MSKPKEQPKEFGIIEAVKEINHLGNQALPMEIEEIIKEESAKNSLDKKEFCISLLSYYLNEKLHPLSVMIAVVNSFESVSDKVDVLAQSLSSAIQIRPEKSGDLFEKVLDHLYMNPLSDPAQDEMVVVFAKALLNCVKDCTKEDQAWVNSLVESVMNISHMAFGSESREEQKDILALVLCGVVDPTLVCNLEARDVFLSSITSLSQNDKRAIVDQAYHDLMEHERQDLAAKIDNLDIQQNPSEFAKTLSKKLSDLGIHYKDLDAIREGGVVNKPTATSLQTPQIDKSNGL